MKKIMFNDKFGLTKAVLEGRKTITRRSIPKKLLENIELYAHGNEEELRHRLRANSSYHVGEVVAIAQSYKDIGERGFVQEKPTQGDEYIRFGDGGGTEHVWAENHAGWTNKMFVKADLMPHHIKITNIRVEHLQDISDEDCLREGIYMDYDAHGGLPFYDYNNNQHNGFDTPREAFAALIDKVSGRGTWDSNPMVWVYEFELLD